HHFLIPFLLSVIPSLPPSLHFTMYLIHINHTSFTFHTLLLSYHHFLIPFLLSVIPSLPFHFLKKELTKTTFIFFTYSATLFLLLFIHNITLHYIILYYYSLFITIADFY